MKNDPKTTWRNINTIFKNNNTKNHNITLIHDNDTITNTKQINNIFAEQLATILSSNNNPQFIQNNITHPQTIFDKINTKQTTFLEKHIKEEETHKNINNLKTNKALGPDGITNKMIKALNPSLSKILTNIFNSCLNIGYFPDTVKL